MKIALQFSGGKDSLATLWLNRDRWDEILVMWVNTGAAYPAVIEWMQGWKKRLPHFLEIKSNQPEQVHVNGLPAEVVPIWYTPFSRVIGGTPPYLIQSFVNCCHSNIWTPLQQAVEAEGVTTVIRGQKRSDKHKAPITDGQQVNGVTYELPVEDWSDKDIFDYLRREEVDIPPYYSKGENTSHDCWNCTAYLEDNWPRIQNLPQKKRAEVLYRLDQIERAVTSEMRRLHG